MSFTFRGDNLKVPFFCVDLEDGQMVSTGERFSFHDSTYDFFEFEQNEDLCHRYSFSSMVQLLCMIYQSGDMNKLGQLIDALFPNDDDDRDSALAVYKKIIEKPEKRVKYFNQLLYIMNNSLLNLRPGNSGWNRSIKSCYDPEEWKYDNSGKFVITSRNDVDILSKLLEIDVDPSTVYFYTAQANDEEVFLYSSNNDFSNEGVDVYESCDIPVCILLEDGTLNQIT